MSKWMSKAMLLAALALGCAGCRRDMQLQPKYVPLDRSWFFSDGRAARPIPAGAVSIDEADVDATLSTGLDGKGDFLTSVPLPVDEALLERGRECFDIYCSPCHGRTGDGHGMIARRGVRQPADLNGARVRNAPPDTSTPSSRTAMAQWPVTHTRSRARVTAGRLSPTSARSNSAAAFPPAISPPRSAPAWRPSRESVLPAQL